MRIFEELDVLAGFEGARVRPLEDAIKFFDDFLAIRNGEKQAGEPVKAACPFGFVGKEGEEGAARPKRQTSVEKQCKDGEAGGGRGPWPFVFFHDKKTFMSDWQTWCLLGLGMCLIYKKWFAI